MSRLAIKEMRLSHFRSHKSVNLTLDGRPVALFGPNGAGKTNIIEAVSLFSPGRGIRRAASDELIRRPESLGWKISVLVQALTSMHELQSFAEPGGNRQVRIDDKASSQNALGRITRMVWLVPSMDRLWIEGADGRRRFLDRMCLSFDPAHAEQSVIYEKAMRERNRLLKDQVRDAHWYLALESRMAEAGTAIQASRRATLERLEQAQALAATQFPAARLRLISAPDTKTPPTPDDFAAALEDNRQRDLYAGRSLIGPHRADLDAVYLEKHVNAKQCSTGEQKALLISLIMSNARALAEDLGAPPILLLDEVAAHLDADRRAALYDEICALRAQAWMTGTGAELFAELGDRAQHLEIGADGEVSDVAER